MAFLFPNFLFFEMKIHCKQVNQSKHEIFLVSSTTTNNLIRSSHALAIKTENLNHWKSSLNFALVRRFVVFVNFLMKNESRKVNENVFLSIFGRENKATRKKLFEENKIRKLKDLSDDLGDDSLLQSFEWPCTDENEAAVPCVTLDRKFSHDFHLAASTITRARSH